MESNRIGFFGFLLWLSVAIAAPTNSELPKENTQITFKPTSYKLIINTREEHFKDQNEGTILTYDGSVTIHLNQTGPAIDKDFQIILNTNPKTKIKKVTLKGNSFDDTNAVKNSTVQNGKLIVNCSKSIGNSKMYTLTVDFTNPFGDDMTGFYRSSYKYSNGTNGWLLTTQFEPIFARNAFPCFDQPHLKALFEIEINIPKSYSTYHALCNTPISNKKPDSDLVGTSVKSKGLSFNISDFRTEGNYIKFTCEETKIPMSTYLVAFTISDFIATKEEIFESDYPNKSKRILKTYGQEKIIKNKEAEMAQKAALSAVKKLGEYLKIGYALPKIDQVGIPDFTAGAMENWGLITFREKSLFFNNSTGSKSTKQYNVLTITHELVHQWFGNLVTLESWNYIWLNEAFATYLGYFISHQIKELEADKWKYLEQFVITETHLRAFETDGMFSSKPLTQDIKDESLIFSAFNDIPYSKGGSVLRMWLHQDPDNFQKSLQEYLKARQCSTANPTQLSEFFKKYMNLTEESFKSWTTNPGYPVVEVKNVKDTFCLSQSRFLWENAKETFKDEKWVIPITFTTSTSKDFNNTKPGLWLQKNGTLVIQGKKDDKWIIINLQQAGYYRVSYPKSNWEALAAALREEDHSKIHELNRAQIINDIFSLARSIQKDYVEYSTALSLTRYLDKEKSFIVWKTALNIFDFLKAKLYGNAEVFKNFKTYVLTLIKPHFKSLNCNGLPHVDSLMAAEISKMACSLDFEDCVNEAKKIYQNKTIVPDTQETVFCTVIRNKNSVWNEVFKKYEKEEDSATKVMYISALGCTNDQKTAELFLNKTLEEKSNIRKQDRIFVIQAVYNNNPKNIDVAFKFVLTNYKKIAQEYGGINPLGRALTGLARKFDSEENLKKLKELKEKFGKDELLKPAKESLESAISITESNIKWTKQRKEQLTSYFKGVAAGSFTTYSFTILSLCLTFVLKFQ